MVTGKRLGGAFGLGLLMLAGCASPGPYPVSPYPADHFSSIGPPEGAVSVLSSSGTAEAPRFTARRAHALAPVASPAPVEAVGDQAEDSDLPAGFNPTLDGDPADEPSTETAPADNEAASGSEGGSAVGPDDGGNESDGPAEAEAEPHLDPDQAGEPSGPVELSEPI